VHKQKVRFFNHINVIRRSDGEDKERRLELEECNHLVMFTWVIKINVKRNWVHRHITIDTITITVLRIIIMNINYHYLLSSSPLFYAVYIISIIVNGILSINRCSRYPQVNCHVVLVIVSMLISQTYLLTAMLRNW